MQKKRGFTFIEIIIVIALMSVLFLIAYVAIDPGRRVADSRNRNRLLSVKTVSAALVNYSLENSELPGGIDDSLRMLGTADNGCDVECGSFGETASACLDLTADLDESLEGMPIDPKEQDEERSYYAVRALGGDAFGIYACSAERDEEILYVVK
jgi:prepilin-type N-terminal cleavage/methylation domain-containing protein